MSPWEIERDPEEDAIWEEKRRRAAEAEARAARAARAKSRRCCPQLVRLWWLHGIVWAGWHHSDNPNCIAT